jgi:hypothetical protein
MIRRSKHFELQNTSTCDDHASRKGNEPACRFFNGIKVSANKVVVIVERHFLRSYIAALNLYTFIRDGRAYRTCNGQKRLHRTGAFKKQFGFSP